MKFLCTDKFCGEIAPRELCDFWVEKYFVTYESKQNVYLEWVLQTDAGEHAYWTCAKYFEVTAIFFIVYFQPNICMFMTQDITEKKKNELSLQQHKNHLEELVQARTQQLEEAMRVKSRFLATMSHGTAYSRFFTNM